MGTPRITATKIIIYSAKWRARILNWTHTNAAWDSIELLVNRHAVGHHQRRVHTFSSLYH